MNKCAGCNGSIKGGRSISEERYGKVYLFCCTGCRKLYDLRILKSSEVKNAC